MAKKIINERCPFRDECERKCVYQGRELDCDYYSANAMPGHEIYDQEQRREEIFRQNEESQLTKATAQEAAATPGQTSGQEEATELEAAEAATEELEGEWDYSKSPVSLRRTAGKGVTYLAGSNGVTEKIKRAMYDAARQFVYIGFLLWEVQEYGYYIEGGYRDVYDYAEAELHFKRSSTKNFIAVCRAFSNSRTIHRANGNISIIGQDISMTLQPKYEQFNYSQLCEMLSMAPAQREQVQPDMTIREIRELKRQPEQEPDLPPDMETIQIELPGEETAGQTSGQEEPEQLAAVTVNNIWADLPKDVVRAIVKAAGLRCTPSMCFDITVKKHDNG